jgi:opacity protein-like surface antigen
LQYFLGHFEENDMLRSVLLTALLAFSASVSAEDFSYNYFSAGYTRINLDDGFVDIDGDAFGLNGSYEINESFYVFAGYGMGEFKEAGITVDLDSLSIGIGWHTPLSDRVDLVTDLSYEYIDLSALGQSVDDNGFGLGVGLRFAATDNVELNAGINYVDFSDGGNDTGFGVGALFGVSDNIDIGLSADWADDTSAYGINGRFYFGN